MNKICKALLKVFVIAFLANAALFAVFWFDLDGKLLFNVVEPFLKKHYDDMDRKDTLKTSYKIDEFPKYDYNS